MKYIKIYQDILNISKHILFKHMLMYFEYISFFFLLLFCLMFLKKKDAHWKMTPIRPPFSPWTPIWALFINFPFFPFWARPDKVLQAQVKQRVDCYAIFLTYIIALFIAVKLIFNQPVLNYMKLYEINSYFWNVLVFLLNCGATR